MNDLLKEVAPLDVANHGVKLPKFTVKKSKFGSTDGSPEKNFAFLKKLCDRGLKEKIDKSQHPKYKKQLEYELDLIKNLGFVDYFLLIWEVTNYCHENDISVGPGRGSASGCLVLYLSGITNIDPLEYNLIFERFLSTDRVEFKEVDGEKFFDGGTLPDVDMDFDYYKRPDLLGYLQEKYDAVKILNLNTFAGKQLIKDCGKIVADYEESEMNLVSSLLPVQYGKVMDLEQAYEEEEKFREWVDENKANREIYDIACKLKGLIRNRGVHASGMLIPNGKSEDSFPMELTKDKTIVSSFDMGWSGNIAIKLDVLGLKTLAVIDETCKKVGLDYNKIDVHDNFIYQQLQDFDHPYGIFQLEAFAAHNGCKKIKPKNLSQLSAVLAICRPGALQFLDNYSKFSEHGLQEAAGSGSKLLDNILAETGNTILYQETLMRIAVEVFELSKLESNHIRRACGKKDMQKMLKYKKIIFEQGEKLNIPEAAEFYWKCLEDAANYSFAAAHSFAYATLSAITIYLKFKHPTEFFHSLLRMAIHEQDPIEKISTIEKELGHFGIKLLPPDIIKSDMDFKIEGKNIRYGLTDIKGINTKSIEKLKNFRSDYNNKFEIFQAANECKIPLNVLCPLIQAGALQGFKQSRSKMVLESQLWNLLTAKEKRLALKYAMEVDNDLIDLIKILKDKNDDKGKPLIRESRLKTLRRDYKPYQDIYNANKGNEPFANWYYEKKLLGFSCKNRLKDIFASQIEMIGAEELEDYLEQRICFISTVKSSKKRVSRNQNEYLDLVVEDEKAEVKVKLFANRNKLVECENMNGGRLPEEGDIVIIKGTSKEGCVFADLITIQDLKIYMKLSEIK